MYSTLDEFKTYICGKKVSVIGVGISNTPLISMLVDFGAIVTAHDKKSENELGEICKTLKDKGVVFSCGDGYLDNISADVVFKTPGLRFDNPSLVKASQKGAVITSEMEVFFDICPSTIIAVTGSDGKTTTTTLIYEMLKAEGKVCHLGGNIGKPVLYRAGDMKKGDYVVLELSSFQLHTMKKSPAVAVITNITPNHLDMHRSYEEYYLAKKNIMKYQSENDVLVLNGQNEMTKSFIGEEKGRLITFSAKGKADIYSDGENIIFNKEPVLKISDIKIPGAHNVENYMAAIAATHGIVSCENICRVAKSFGGVPHRIELVREHLGVKYYNSSIDSSPNRTINTLNVFKKPVILIAGGKDKGITYDEIGPAIADKVKVLILIGATSGVIKKAVLDEFEKRKTNPLPIYEAKSYKEAVLLAKENAKDGDDVVLSNASTSFDMFKNFEERGELFKELVKAL